MMFGAPGKSASGVRARCFGRSDQATIIVVARRLGRSEEADAGDRRETGASRLSAYPYVAPAGGLGREREAYLSALRGDGAAAAAQVAEASGEAKLREGRGGVLFEFSRFRCAAARAQ